MLAADHTEPGLGVVVFGSGDGFVKQRVDASPETLFLQWKILNVDCRRYTQLQIFVTICCRYNFDYHSSLPSPHP